MTATLTAEQAESLEAAFLGGLEEAQFAYGRIVEHEAWKPLGFDRFADWWDERVTPTMHALSMRPTREIAAAVIERVRQDEAELPPAQRRTQQELADMVGVHRDTISGRKRQDQSHAEVPPATDLELAPGEEEPPLPVEFPKGQERGDSFMAGIDAVESAAPEPERPSPPKWDPGDRRQHEAEALRLRDIADAQQQAKTLVPDVRALIFTVLQGSRQGAKGLVTHDMIADIRRAVDLLEGEINDEE